MSVSPENCILIENGKKTVDIRKTRPKIKTPFKCYIYCAKGNIDSSFYCGLDGIKNGKITGEFICDEIYPVKVHSNCAVQNWDWFELSRSCLSLKEIAKYIGANKTGYGWHISDLVIYDNPKELNEFATVCEGLKPYQCDKCEYSYTESNESIGTYHECCCNNLKPLKRPPQSWCYVEEVT